MAAEILLLSSASYAISGIKEFNNFIRKNPENWDTNLKKNLTTQKVIEYVGKHLSLTLIITSMVEMYLPSSTPLMCIARSLQVATLANCNIHSPKKFLETACKVGNIALVTCIVGAVSVWGTSFFFATESVKAVMYLSMFVSLLCSAYNNFDG
ncbi:MAG: hypothetical protein AAF443_08820 [Chlamydiota bacterium]